MKYTSNFYHKTLIITGTFTTDEEHFKTTLKTNSVLLNEVKGNETCKDLEIKINFNNAATLYSISQIFQLSSLSKFTLPFIERCFPMVAESDNFLELQFKSVAKILSNSALNIDSELQVYNAAYSWLCHNITERRKYARNMLLKIRLSLLSTPVLNSLLDNNSCLIDEFADSIKSVLIDEGDFNTNKFTTTSRYCNQNNFNILVCGGEDTNTHKVVSDVYSIKANNLNNINILPQMTEGLRKLKAVFIKGEIYAIGDINQNGNRKISVEKYSPTTNTWEKVADMYDDRSRYLCACSFMDNVYVIGGSTTGWSLDTTKSCVEFNQKNQAWKKNCKNERSKVGCGLFSI